MTVAVGQILEELGLALQIRQDVVAANMAAAGRNFDVRSRTVPRVLPIENIRSRQGPRIPVNADHRPDVWLGHVIHLEKRGRHLWAVCQLDEIPEDIGPLYFSIETNSRWQPGSAVRHDIEITGVGLVERTATACVAPIKLLPGTLDSHTDRSRWQLTGIEKPIVDNAVQALGDRRHNRPIQVRGLTDTAAELRAYIPDGNGGYILRDELPDWRGRPAGRLRHAVHRGRVISVR